MSATSGRFRGAVKLEALEGRRLLASASVGSGEPSDFLGTGLTAEYFNNKNFTSRVLTRVDPSLSWNWGTASPAAGVDPDTFSVRWTGKYQAQSTGVHTFHVRSDDGVRLWLDNKLIVNHFTDHSPTVDFGSLTLQAGRLYDIRIDYYENTGSAVMQLWYSLPGVDGIQIAANQLYPAGNGDGLLGAYFNGVKNFYEDAMDGLSEPQLRRIDATVNFDFGRRRPAPSISADRFSIRWTGQVQAEFTETYRFYTRSDDGVRLFVDGKKIIDAWDDHSVTEHSGLKKLEAGRKYDIRLEFYENTGNATAQLLWQSAHTPRQIIPRRCLFSADASRMAWWREARFGMFIHFGLYSVLAGRWNGQATTGSSEWIMKDLAIFSADYEKTAARFNPTGFNARQWVSAAKNAGMKYIIITTKHHDGFCLFDTKVHRPGGGDAQDYDIMNTPFGRDLVRELADEARRQGLRIGFYYSLLDWHHPDYAPRRESGDDRPGDGDYAKYFNEYALPQIRELLGNYGRVDVLWIDGGWDHPASEGADRIIQTARSLQPGIIINNRTQVPADFFTPEQDMSKLPVAGSVGDWEFCMTMNDNWGYSLYDNRWKSTATLVRDLVEMTSRGGNFLLNVGPTGTGLFPATSSKRLKSIGGWLLRNGQSIYGAGARNSVVIDSDIGRVTSKRGMVFLHVYNWPASRKLSVLGLGTNVRKAYLLSDAAQTALPFIVSLVGVQAITISLPPKPTTDDAAFDAVIAVELTS